MLAGHSYYKLLFLVHSIKSFHSILFADECSSAPCLHGGSCEDQENGFICNCVDGFDGDICDNQKICENGVCENGRCIGDYTVNNRHCVCQDGYTSGG